MTTERLAKLPVLWLRLARLMPRNTQQAQAFGARRKPFSLRGRGIGFCLEAEAERDSLTARARLRQGVGFHL